MRKNKLIIFLISSVFLSDVYARIGLDRELDARDERILNNSRSVCTHEEESSYESYAEQFFGGQTITE